MQAELAGETQDLSVSPETDNTIASAFLAMSLVTGK
jgi:hypothetical protein